LARNGGGTLPPSSKTAVPGDWGALLGGDFRGRVRYRRWFHRPAELDPHERAWLVVEGLDPRGTVSLNGSLLGEVRGYALPSAFDVTPLLLLRNELHLEIDFPPDGDPESIAARPGRAGLPGGPLGEVRLEIRGPYFVEDFALTAFERDGEVDIAATGQVEGHVETNAAREPLELIVAGECGELLVGEVMPGEAFFLNGVAPPFAPWRAGQPCRPLDVEARLLHGGTRVWQRTLRLAHRPPWDETAANAAETIVQILGDADYERFDQQGRAVVQCLPGDWAAAVCPRLAHHPSIVGWRSDGFPRQAIAVGRPWLSPSLVAAERIF
jgi:hypothetical protein